MDKRKANMLQPGKRPRIDSGSIRWGFHVLFVLGCIHICRWFVFYLSVDFYRLFVQSITNSHSQGSNPKWSNALSATGGAAWRQRLLRWDANSQGGEIHIYVVVELPTPRVHKKYSVRTRKEWKMSLLRMSPPLPSVMPSLPQRSTRRWPTFSTSLYFFYFPNHYH